MKKINTTLQKSGWVALCCLLAAPSMAQTPLPEDALPIMVVPSERSIGAQERLLSLDVESNVPFDVTDDADWLQVQKEGTKIYLHATQNYANTPRTAKVTLTCTEEGKELTKVMALTQSADDSMNYLPEDSRYKPSGAETTGGEEGQNTISATFDSNLRTSYTAQLTDGKELVSVSRSGISFWREGTVGMRPKWGLYRSFGDNGSLKPELRDEILKFADFKIEKL